MYIPSFPEAPTMAEAGTNVDITWMSGVYAPAGTPKDVVARLTSETPGERAKWDAEVVLKLVVFGLLPLLTLFAAQFPDIGATLLHWLEPVEKVLP